MMMFVWGFFSSLIALVLFIFGNGSAETTLLACTVLVVAMLWNVGGHIVIAIKENK